MRFTIILTMAAASLTTATMDAKTVIKNVDEITSVSADTDKIARSLSFTNLFSTGPRLLNSFRRIVTLATNDISAMKKRELDPIQDCVGLEELGCNEDVDDDEGVLVVPDEILDHEQSSSNGVTGTSHTLPLGTRQSAGFTEDDQLAVCESFRGFVRVHQQLLATVIGKYGLLASTPFTQPLALVLSSIEKLVDTLAFAIIDLVPVCSDNATKDKNSLDKALGDAINKYE